MIVFGSMCCFDMFWFIIQLAKRSYRCLVFLFLPLLNLVAQVRCAQNRYKNFKSALHHQPLRCCMWINSVGNATVCWVRSIGYSKYCKCVETVCKSPKAVVLPRWSCSVLCFNNLQTLQMLFIYILYSLEN